MAPSSVFPDVHIPPTPHAGGDRSTSQDHHLILPYISRILMEDEQEDIDPQHPALLQAQQPFAQILSSSGTLASAFSGDQGAVLAGDTHARRSSAKDNGGQGTLSSAVFKGADAVGSEELLPTGREYNTDVFRTAFFKGMEEANRFLPTGNNKPTTGGRGQPNEKSGRGRKDRQFELEAEVVRTSKLVMAEPVEAGAREMFDQMMLNGYDICIKGMEDLRIAMDIESGRNNRKGRKERGRRGGAAEVVDLHTLLVHCAKAVMDDRRSAGELLKEIRQHASPTGDATQRLAYCFAEGLEARLAGTGSQVYRSVTAKRTSAVEFLKAYQLFMSTCCFRKVAFSFANRSIFDAAVGRSRLHIVDYGLHHGFQWPELLRWLGARDGGPPEVRITHIDLPQPGFRPGHQMEELGNRLTKCAHELGVPFKYRAVAAQWQTVGIDDLNMEPDEALAVNDLFNFRTLMEESAVVDSPSPRDAVLNNISRMQPDVFVQGTVNGLYGTSFLSRFREALFYHSALFDMLDATMPRESQLRLVLERDIFGWAALNAIACEGEDRVERGDTYRRWQLRNRRAGLRQLPLNGAIVTTARDMVRNHYHKDFVLEEDQQWLLQGWKGRILFAHSTWVADGASSDR